VALVDTELQSGPSTRPVDEFRELARAQLPRLYSLARRLVGDDAERHARFVGKAQPCTFRFHPGTGTVDGRPKRRPGPARRGPLGRVATRRWWRAAA
jgi:hypothetical protein